MPSGFDEAVSTLALDYSAAFRNLLELCRSDRLIPLTAGNDDIIHSEEVVNAMV